jgi:hypothetical protein
LLIGNGSCIAAVILTGLAMLVVFGFRPGGFETQGAWFVLLPGAFLALPLADLAYKIAPRADPVVAYGGTIALSFLWYWGISFIAIKNLRTASWKGF